MVFLVKVSIFGSSLLVIIIFKLSMHGLVSIFLKSTENAKHNSRVLKVTFSDIFLRLHKG